MSLVLVVVVQLYYYQKKYHPPFHVICTRMNIINLNCVLMDYRHDSYHYLRLSINARIQSGGITTTATVLV